MIVANNNQDRINTAIILKDEWSKIGVTVDESGADRFGLTGAELLKAEQPVKRVQNGSTHPADDSAGPGRYRCGWRAAPVQARTRRKPQPSALGRDSEIYSANRGEPDLQNP